MKQNYPHIVQRGECLSQEMLEKYHSGSLSAKERFEVERHLLSCEICSDVLEGLSLFENTDEVSKIEAELNNKVQQLLQKNDRRKSKVIMYRRLSAAASILLICSVSYLIYTQYFNKPSNVAVLSKTVDTTNLIARNKGEVSNAPVLDNLRKNTNKPRKKNVKKESTSTLPVNAVKTDTMASGIISEPAFILLADESDDSISIRGNTGGLSITHNILAGRVEGLVRDENGVPLPGVSVIVKGSAVGTVTDMDGKFRFDSLPANCSLECMFVGYTTATIDFKGQSELDVKLKPDLVALDEVVVIGYGVSKRKALASAVTKVLSGKAGGIYVSDERHYEIEQEIDSLRKASNVENDWNVKRLLAEKYIELGEKENALSALDDLTNLSSGDELRQAIANIRLLVEEDKYAKALKKLKALK